MITGIVYQLATPEGSLWYSDLEGAYRGAFIHHPDATSITLVYLHRTARLANGQVITLQPDKRPGRDLELITSSLAEAFKASK